MVTLPPLVEGVNAIALPGTSVSSLISPGQDPDSTPLNVAQIRRLEKADLIVSTGQMPFELQLAKRCSQDPKLAKKLLVVMPKQNVHRHSGDDFHEGNDPHTWMSVTLYSQMMFRVSQKLIRDNPTKTGELKARFLSYNTRLDALSKSNLAILAQQKGKTLLVFHPALGYLCADHGLTQLAIERHSESSSGKYLINLTRTARKSDVKAVFVEKMGASSQTKTVAKELKVKVVEIDLLSPYYIANMKRVVALISENI